MLATGRRPAGQPTRGFTAPNRLRTIDTYLAVAHREWLRRISGVAVDLGYGERPVTTLEWFRRLREHNPGLAVLGVELDPARVAAALPFSRPGLDFRRGGFNLPLRPGERTALIRAINVLRQYEEEDVQTALALLAPALEPGGLLLEGTTNPTGSLAVFNVFLRRPAPVSPGRRLPAATLLHDQALVFAARPLRGFEPADFRAVLPKRSIHHAEPGGALDAFFQRWARSWRFAAADRLPWSVRFVRAARALADAYPGLSRAPSLLRRGLLVVPPALLARP